MPAKRACGRIFASARESPFFFYLFTDFLNACQTAAKNRNAKKEEAICCLSPFADMESAVFFQDGQGCRREKRRGNGCRRSAEGRRTTGLFARDDQDLRSAVNARSLLVFVSLPRSVSLSALLTYRLLSALRFSSFVFVRRFLYRSAPCTLSFPARRSLFIRMPFLLFRHDSAPLAYPVLLTTLLPSDLNNRV